MAVVKLTKTLVDAISSKAYMVAYHGSNPKGDIEATINKQLKHIDLVPAGERVYREILGEHYDAVHALPAQMFRTMDCIYVSCIGDVYTDLVLPLAEERRLPGTTTAFGTGVISYIRNRTVFRQTSGPAPHNHLPRDAAEVRITSALLPDVYQLVKEYTDKRDKTNDEANQMESNVRKLLSRHSSLAPALKEWPPLWDLLDEETKERHKRVKTTKKQVSSDDDEGLDLSSMTTKLTQAKLLGYK